jgi:acyl-CoA thioester hydrolase
LISQLVPFQYSTTIQLRWKDIDQFGHVNNAVYLTYFETARYYYNRDVNQWDWNQDQYIIASIKVDYLRPIFYPGDIKVFLRIGDIGDKSFVFHYAITFEKNGIEKLAATGQSTQVFYDI